MDYTKLCDYYPVERETLSVFLDKINRVKRSWEPVFTDFISPAEQIVLKEICGHEGLYTQALGGIGYFERAVCSVSRDEYTGDFPVDVIKITGNFKFEKVTHRDYLGGVLSLGIKREKLGDINVFEDGAEIWIRNDISGYVCANLTKIKHTGIKGQIIRYTEAREKIQEFKELKINISSMRLDCIVSSLTGSGRSEAADIVKGGLVKIDHMMVDEPSKKVDEGQMLSIKGYGRFFIEYVVGKTKSDRINLSVKKFI